MYKRFKITLPNHPSVFKIEKYIFDGVIFGIASWLLREAEHSPPFIAEVKKEASITSLLHTSSWRNI
jgi:hypothetical protein